MLVFQVDQYSDVPATYGNPFTATVIRLSVKRSEGDDFVHLNEWSLTASMKIQVTGRCFLPNGLRFISGASFQMQVRLLDTAGITYTLPGIPVGSLLTPVER